MIKIMTDKLANGTQKLMCSMISKYEWESGPWSLYLILVDAFSAGAALTWSCHEEFQKIAVQTACGQELATSIYQSQYDSDPTHPINVDKWTELCRASGFWVQIKTKLLPLVLFSESMIDALDNDFKATPAFRDMCSQLVDKEPPSAHGDDKMKDLGNWVVHSISYIKSAHEQAAAERKATGDSLPGAILGKDEAAQLNAINFVASFQVDINNYNIAAKALSEEREGLVSQWQLLQKKHVEDVKRFQHAMQGSDICFWQPSLRKKLRQNKEWLTVAVQEALQHKQTLKKVMGCRGSDILQVNVFALYMLGTTKKTVIRNQISVARCYNNF